MKEDLYGQRTDINIIKNDMDTLKEDNKEIKKLLNELLKEIKIRKRNKKNNFRKRRVLKKIKIEREDTNFLK